MFGIKSTFLLVAIILFYLISFSAAFIKIDPESRHFLDESGRVRIFHGVNAVYKVPPYHPDLEQWGPQTSMTERDVDDLAEWGFNFVRLGTMWPGVVPSKGNYNQTYLKTLGQLVQRFGEKEIYTLLDCHQDLLSPKFCGEGTRKDP